MIRCQVIVSLELLFECVYPYSPLRSGVAPFGQDLWHVDHRLDLVSKTDCHFYGDIAEELLEDFFEFPYLRLQDVHLRQLNLL